MSDYIGWLRSEAEWKAERADEHYKDRIEWEIADELQRLTDEVSKLEHELKGCKWQLKLYTEDYLEQVDECARLEDENKRLRKLAQDYIEAHEGGFLANEEQVARMWRDALSPASTGQDND